jgi:hypothetical protein
MYKNIPLFFLCAIVLLFLAAEAKKPAKNKVSRTHYITDEIGESRSLDLQFDRRELKATAVHDTFVLGSWTFDTGGFADPQGWTGQDRTLPEGCFWHVDDLAGLGGGTFGGLNPLEGSQSLWCGIRPDVNDIIACRYAVPPGYGNDWDQSWCFKCIEVPDTEYVVIEYLASWDSEPGYDYTYLEYFTKGTCDSLQRLEDIISGYHAGYWENLYTFDSSYSKVFRSDTIHAGHQGAIKIRFRFRSDGSWSDEDALYDTDGAILIDSITVKAELSGMLDFEDFEGESIGDTVTTDGDWYYDQLSGYGMYAALFPGGTVLQEDPCYTNTSFLWAFFNGSTSTYECGGHPEQASIPYGNARGQYFYNEIWSPHLEWTGPGTLTELVFDVYRDMKVDDLVFYTWFVRSWVDGCPGEWRNNLYWLLYGSTKTWSRVTIPIEHLIEPGASHIQIALASFDGCMIPLDACFLAYVKCHSHGPLFDNVEVRRIDINGPYWSVKDYDLFQDTFPTNGTSLGTGRIDAAMDVVSFGYPNIQPGDSSTVTCSDSEFGIRTPDPRSGSGSAVYLYFRVDPSRPLGADAEGDATRWPLVDSISCSGEMWYLFRCDTVFTEDAGPRTSPVENMWCVDLNDNYFTNGDTLWFFFGAENAINEWSWWSEFTGATDNIYEVCLASMEMQILPTSMSDYLYVDYYDGLGAQPYFDDFFRFVGCCEDEIDRFDSRGPTTSRSEGWNYYKSPGFAHHVTNVQQLIENYRTILWNSGDLPYRTVGDGDRLKSDDYQMLYTFLDLHTDPNGAGIYFSGDNLAEELDGMTTASAQNFKNTYMPHVLITDDHKDFVSISPYGIGEASGTGTPTSVGIFEEDTLIAYGGCPILNDFDVIAPAAGATIEMCYDPVNEADDTNPAVVAYDTLNSLGNRVATVLSGFSYHNIRDDKPQNVPDRIDHLAGILSFLANGVSSPTIVRPAKTFRNNLAQNYPNPFNPVTTIRYSIRQRGHVSLKVYNVAGQMVRTLVYETQNPRVEGYATIWKGLNDSGESVSSGVYFYRLVAKEFTITKKMVLIR